MNTRRMARKLAAHGKTCAAARQGSGKLVPCPCGQSLGWLCGCGRTVILRGGACGELQANDGARNGLAVY